MHDFDSTKQTPLMLAVRSGRYEDVQAMLDLGSTDFHIAGRPSAWDYCTIIQDPQMLQIMSEGRLKTQLYEWRKNEHKFEHWLQMLPDF